MQALFYHDHRAGAPRRTFALTAGGMLVLIAIGCGTNSTPTPRDASASVTQPIAAPQATIPSATLTGAETPTATSASIARARAVLDRRAAGGGPALTAVRSLEITGTSQMTGLKVPRTLTVRALFPSFFRQEEAPAGNNAKTFHTVIGMQDTIGWIAGATLAGDGSSTAPGVAARAHTIAGRQAMAGFLAGISAPWLLDSERYTFTDGGVINAGADRGSQVLLIDGPDGRVGRLLIDPDTHLPRRLIEPPQAGSAGTSAVADIVFTYSDYQPQDGLQLPRTIVRDNGPNRTIFSLEKYTINPKLKPQQFSRMKQR
jgi:hypothetical protein